MMPVVSGYVETFGASGYNYIRLPPVPADYDVPTGAQNPAELLGLLENSIGRAVHITGRVGVSLGGGIDSSCNHRPFCAGLVPAYRYRHSRLDTAPATRKLNAVADYFHTDHHEVIVQSSCSGATASRDERHRYPRSKRRTKFPETDLPLCVERRSF